MSYFSFSSICMLLSEPRCYLFSQNAGKTCGKDQSTVQLEVERLEDSGQLVIFKKYNSSLRGSSKKKSNVIQWDNYFDSITAFEVLFCST